MKANFQTALDAVLLEEGGFVNDPRDPGGATNFGVTQATYNAYLAARGEDMRAVTAITQAEVADIYKSMYWDKVRGDDLPSGIDLSVFDAAVSCGPYEAAMFLQRALGDDIVVDGKIGPLTIAAADDPVMDADLLLGVISDERLAFYRRLSTSTWKAFGRGWSNRVASIEVKALALADTPAPSSSAAV
jgi:lysozyme family protein